MSLDESDLPGTEPALGRLELERIEFGRAVGWCVAAGLEWVAVHLRLAGDVLPVDVHRLARPDVDAALGLTGSAAHGFEIQLPWQAWVSLLAPEGADAAVVWLCAGEAEIPLVDSTALNAWRDQLHSLGPGLAYERAFQHCLLTLAPVCKMAPLAIGETNLAWLRRQASDRGWDAVLVEPATRLPEPQPVRGVVEAFEATVVRGWACAAAPCAGEVIRLCINGESIPAAVIRTCRDDVQRALKSPRLQLGFEIEVPSSIWHQLDPAIGLQVSVLINGQSVDARQWSLDLDHLIAELERLQQESLRLQAQGALAVDPGEFQYRMLLALEHVLVSRIWTDLPPSLLRFVLMQADRYGLHDAFDAGVAAQAVAGHHDVAAQPGAAVDPTTVSVWRLLRQFNEAVRACPEVDRPLQLGAMLQRVLDQVRPSGEVRFRGLLSLIPFFCAHRAYEQLRPLLPLHRVRMLGLSAGAWELSLALPEAVSSGDYAWACELVASLARGAKGWLNTECLAHAAQVTVDQLSGEPLVDQAPLQWVRGLQALLAGLAEDPWSRTPDVHLMSTLVSLLELGPALPEAVAAGIATTAMRLHALSPDFWLVLAQRLPDAACWPVGLRDVHRLASQLDARLQKASSASPTLGSAALWHLVPAMQGLARQRQGEAPQVLRELVQALVLQTDSADADAASRLFAELDQMDPSEPLRLAAHPLCSPAWLDSAPDLKSRIRAVSGIPVMGRPELRVAALRGLQSSKQPSLATCRVLARAEDGELGVLLMAWRWLASRHLVQDGDLQALSELRECWLAVHQRTGEGSIPPAPLLDAWRLLQRELGLSDGSSPLAALVQEMTLQLGPVTLELPPPDAAHQVLIPAAPGHNTLVAIYSCRNHLQSRVDLIRQTWARDLTRRGIPWIVVVGDGRDALEGDAVLGLACSDAYEDLPAKTLAMIRWVLQNTDFDHLLKIDDDCHLAVDAFFDESPHLTQHYLGRRLQRAEGGTDRRWHHAKSSGGADEQILDKSPEPSVYADGGAGYALSRLAMARLVAQLATTAGARLTRSAFMEDKLVGDLLARAGIPLSSVGYETLVRRRLRSDHPPVSAFQNTFYPSRYSPTLVSHLDDAGQLAQVCEHQSSAGLLPARIWPTLSTPVLGGVAGTNQLELLSPASRLRELAGAPVVVVAVARNEIVLMPHFLAHYRRLGVSHFVLVDNLSDDGTREYLQAQPDVVLYSADTEYRHSHFGVAWQQAVLGAHALGKWVVLADIDEFLVYGGCEQLPIAAWLQRQEAAGHDAVLTLMVDMYPQGDLAEADFERQTPFAAAPCFDREPVLRWELGSGCFSNGPTYLSALRHRVIPDSAPNLYTSQKVAVLRYRPWIRLSEGLHYASNIRMATERAAFCHFKYHAGFKAKVHAEIARRQHFNGAEEYRKYLAMVAEGSRPLFDPQHSVHYQDSRSLQGLYRACAEPSASGANSAQ